MSKKLDQTLEIEILKYLAISGVGYKSNVTTILENHYSEGPKSIEDIGIETRWSIIHNYLKNMKNRSLIRYTDLTNENEKWPAKWKSKVVFEAELTHDGLQYLYYLNNQELSNELGKSTLATNKRTIFILWLTVAISLGSLLVTILDYNKP